MKTLSKGFTLIELMITLAIAGVLMTMAVPAFNDYVRNSQLVTQANELITSINVARSESIKRAIDVNICSSNDQATCTNSSWQDGWIVITTDAVPELILVHEGLPAENTLTNGTTTITYAASGFLNGAASTFQLCDTRTGETGRQIIISNTGNARVQDLACA